MKYYFGIDFNDQRKALLFSDFDTKDILAYLMDIKPVSKEETEFTFTIQIL